MEIDVKHIAKLANLSIEPEKVNKFTEDLLNIIQMVENLPDMEGDIVLLDPDHPLALREDDPKQHFTRDELLHNAPQVQAGCVVVPRIVE